MGERSERIPFIYYYYSVVSLTSVNKGTCWQLPSNQSFYRQIVSCMYM